MIITDQRASLYLGNSIDVLKEILPKIDESDKILFWMDSHFPGTDFGLEEKKYIFDDYNMPLSQELDVIKNYRNTDHDSFIIDDLRLYENGNYQLGDLDIGREKSGIGFIENSIKNHLIQRDYRHQGFLILSLKYCPK